MSRENGMEYMYYNSRSPFDTNLHSLHSSTMYAAAHIYGVHLPSQKNFRNCFSKN